MIVLRKFSLTICLVLAFNLLVPLWGSAQADVAAGKKVYKKCKACHRVGERAKNGVGPHLNNLFDRPIAGLKDYKYSKAFMKQADTGLVWDADNLAEFLKNPKSFIPKTKMVYAGLRKEKDIQNLIAYLRSFSLPQ